MAEATFFLRPLNATDALSSVIALARTVFHGKTFTSHLSTNLAGVGIDARDVQPNSFEQRAEVTTFRKRLEATNNVLSCSAFTIIEAHHPNNTKPSLKYSLSDSIVAQLTIEHFADPDRLVAATLALTEIFKLVPRHAIVLEALPAPQQEAIRHQAAVTAELQVEVSRIGAFNLDQLKRQDAFFQTLTSQHEARYQEREEQLRQQRQRMDDDFRARQKVLEDEHRARINALEEREREHQKRVAEHDTRESTAVRRELLVKLEELLEKQKDIQISDKTIRKRRLVHVLCALGMLAAAGLVAYFAVKVASDTDPRWHHITPLSAGVLLFASTLVYYVKWTDHWFREHARVEFQNRKLRSDIVRASWLAELIFEGRDKGRELPDLLVGRFSDGLFLDSGDRSIEHPSESVVAFLQKVSSIKVGQGTLEVTKTASKEG